MWFGYWGWCKVRKHSMKVKEQKCLKHNCCFSCLKTTDYKSDSCPDRRECRLCKKYHHFNLHPRLDIIKFYQEEKGNVGRQWLVKHLVIQQQSIHDPEQAIFFHTLTLPIKNKPVKILLGTASSHTVINYEIAKFLQAKIFAKTSVTIENIHGEEHYDAYKC